MPPFRAYDAVHYGTALNFSCCTFLLCKSSSSPKKKIIRTTKKKNSKRSGGLKISTPKTPKEVSAAMYKFMCEEHSLGVTEWSKIELANAVGYTSPRSDKCGKGFKVLVVDEKLAEKGSCSKSSDTLVLTANGIHQKPVDSKPKDINDVHTRFIKGVEKKVKMGSNKVRPLWEILMNRQVHDIKAVSEMLGYKNPRSFENTKIIATMKDMGLVTNNDLGKGKIQITNKPFPILDDVLVFV